MTDDALPTSNRNRRNVLIKERGAVCHVCGWNCEPAIEVHHITRRIDGGAHDRSNLVLLCANCHSVVEYFRGPGKWHAQRRQEFTQYTDEQFNRLLECLPPMTEKIVDTLRLRHRLAETINRMAA
jgi:hypothetical protein